MSLRFPQNILTAAFLVIIIENYTAIFQIDINYVVMCLYK